MQRKSSIHIEQGNLGFLFHNDRTKPTANSIFSQEKNEYFNDAKTALEIYRQELQKRSKAYTKRTGKKLHKNTITHLSAIINLEQHHTLQDVKKIAEYLEQELDTKVFQIAIHKDEGYLDEETGEKHINYHAHLELMGLDTEGKSIRRKLDRKFLINLQSKVAEILQMERGINYTAERKKRPKRLDTYEYKEHAKRQAQKEKELLAKVKDLKELNKQLREQLKEARAKREQYAQLEAFVKDLKEQVKAKELTIEQLKEKMQQKEKELLEQIQQKDTEIEELQDKNNTLLVQSREKDRQIEQLQEQVQEKEHENFKLSLEKWEDTRNLEEELETKKHRIEHLEEELDIQSEELEQLQKEKEEAEKKVEELEKQVYSPYCYKDTNKLVPWSAVAKQRKKTIEQLKKEKEEEKKRREKAEQEAEELKQELERLKNSDNYKLPPSTPRKILEQNEQLRKENKQLKEENEQLKKFAFEIAETLDVYDFKEMFADLKTALGKVIKAAKEMKDYVKMLINLNAELNKENEQLKNQDDWSGGWKL